VKASTPSYAQSVSTAPTRLGCDSWNGIATGCGGDPPRCRRRLFSLSVIARFLGMGESEGRGYRADTGHCSSTCVRWPMTTLVRCRLVLQRLWQLPSVGRLQAKRLPSAKILLAHVRSWPFRPSRNARPHSCRILVPLPPNRSKKRR
jgi:hypothetical protein